MINDNGGKMPNAIEIPEDQLREAAKLSVCKINIDSDLRLATGYHPSSSSTSIPAVRPARVSKPARANNIELVRHKARRRPGCAGKAWPLQSKAPLLQWSGVIRK